MRKDLVCNHAIGTAAISVIYKYYYSILSMMMMRKEGMVCFIVFFDNKNWWFGERSSLYLNYWESYDNFIDFMAVTVNLSLQKNPLKMTALHRPRYYYEMLSMHNQQKNKLLSAKTRPPSWLPDHIDFTDKNTKNTICTRVYSGSTTGRHLLPPSILGIRI